MINLVHITRKTMKMKLSLKNGTFLNCCLAFHFVISDLQGSSFSKSI